MRLMRGERKGAAALPFMEGGAAGHVIISDGTIILYPAKRQDMPHWWHVVGGAVVARHRGTKRPDWLNDNAPVTVMLPPSLAILRADAAEGAGDASNAAQAPARPMSDAQYRTIKLHQALSSGVESAEAMHGVVMDRPSPTSSAEQDLDGFRQTQVALISRADMEYILRWSSAVGVEPVVIFPIEAALLRSERNYIRVSAGDGAFISGSGLIANADEPWLGAIIGDVPVEDWSIQQAEDVLLAAFANPPVNLRSGAFAAQRNSGADAHWAKRVILWSGLALLLTLIPPLMLMAKYHWNAAQMDAQTLELARPYIANITDAAQASAEIDRQVAAQGGAYAFTGPLTGLMQAIQGVAGVSLSSLSLQEDGLLHATLASAQADEINRVLSAVQGAGYRITATSSTDPGGRVIAEITVKP